MQTIARTTPRGDQTVNLTLKVHTNGGIQLGTPSTSVLTITDPPSLLPTVSFGPNNTQTVPEINGGTNQVFANITVTGLVTSAVVVNWGAGAAGDTARAGTDYQISSPTQLIFSSAGSQTVTLSIFDDNGSDIAKTLTLWISPQVANGQLIGPSTDTIIIDEVPVAQPLVFLPSWTLETTQNTVLYCPVSIDRLPQPGTTVQVLFNTIDATPLSAVAGVDYQRVQNFTVSFTSAGPQFVNVPITIDSNSLQQSNVTFAVALSSPVNASLGVSFGTVTIINAPTSLVQFTSANYLAKDKDKNVNLTVVLSQPCPNDLTVNYSTSPGTAKPATPTSSGDYTAVSGALKFPAGLTSKTFQVPIVDDNGVEPDETFVVSLSGLAPVQWAPFQPAAFGAISRAVVTIHDTDTAVPAVTIDSTTVLESVGTAQVHAKLSRPYSIPFKFTYQTTDGSATSATDYSAIPPTTVQFDLQSTQKTINVAIKNTDPYETPESFTIGAAGATNSNYTCNLYSDLLSRDADAVGFNTCLTNLSNGLSLNAIAQSFVGSAEFVTGVVSQAYQRLLFRSADGGGSAYWTRQVVMVNHITLETLLGKLAGSDEYFTSRAGYNSTFIQLIYYDILGRAADTAGYNNWLSQLNNGTKTREQIATALATSTEYFDNYVNAMYQRYLHRAADATGYNYWTNQLINGLSRSETFIAGLVGSVEYFHNLNLQSSTGTVTITDNPLITQPPDQRNFEFDTVSLAITATGLTGDTLTYSSPTNLPAGLGMNSSGVISGTIADSADEAPSNGQYTVSVSVTDQQNNSTTTVQFNWTVLDVNALQSPGFPDLAMPDTCGCQTDLVGTATGATASADGPASGFSSETPVRFFDGVVQIDSSKDISSSGFGMDFGLDRSWTNGAGYATLEFNGSGMVDSEFPFVMQDGSGSHFAVISNGTNARFCDLINGVYTSRYYLQEAFSDDGQDFVLKSTTGQVLRFWDYNVTPTTLRGRFKSITDPYGNVTKVMDWTPAPDSKPTEVQRSVTANGQTTIESFLYSYNAGLLSGVTWQRQDNGVWTTIRQVGYTYGPAAYANQGDLQFVTVTDGNLTHVLDTSYFRYYTDASSGGYVDALKYYFGPESYARLKAALGDPHNVNLTDDQVKSYADYAFQFDSSHRVSEVVIQGQGKYDYTYSASSNPVGYNSWAHKTIELLSDGSKYIAYTNYVGEIMLLSFVNSAGTQAWNTFYKYDSAGRLILTAEPSSVISFDDSKADLMNFVGSASQYLKSSAGLIETTDYYPTTTAGEGTPGGVAGYEQDTKIQQGQGGTAIPQSSSTYSAHSAGGFTVYVPGSDSVFPTGDPTVAQTTNYSYTWYPTYFGVQSLKVTLPVINYPQNGSGALTSETSVFDNYGNEIWHRDADGYVSSTAYDLISGAVVQSVDDVVTSPTVNPNPLGWTTPQGGGLNLTTTRTVDALGRTTKMVDPNGNITYYVYNDLNYEVMTYPGWLNGAPTGPTEVVREDRAHSYVETFTMSATPNLRNNVPDGTETVSNLQTLSRDYINSFGQVFRTDDYFNLTGLGYSTDSYIGVASPNTGANYYTTLFGYDGRGRQIHQVNPTLTITDTTYDSLGRVTGTFVGTNDSGANNMVQVSADFYDNGGTGDSNLTEEDTFTSAGAAPRVVQYYYDWRDRVVASKSGIIRDAQGNVAYDNDGTHRPILYTVYDNLDEVLSQQQYDGDGVSLPASNGTGLTWAPPSGLLRAETDYQYDDQGRVFATHVFSVDQSSGSVSMYSLTTSVWYDLRGDVIKTAQPGGLVYKTQYDGAGRPVVTYTTDGGGDYASTMPGNWTSAASVGSNNVLSQMETQYDANGNAILVTTRERNHDETATGALGNAITGPKARVSYAAAYYDALDRPTATVDVGTNGGGTYSRPATVPPDSDTTLVSSYFYNNAGWLFSVTDPRGIVTATNYDNLGRITSTIENWNGGVPTNSFNKTTQFTYDGDNNLLTYTAVGPNGQQQTTQYVYGVSTAFGSGNDINSNDILATVKHPDPVTGLASNNWNQQDSFTVNALGETKTATDRNGTVHSYSYDVLGRLTADAVTTLATGVDSAVQRIQIAYDTGGRPNDYTSFNASTGGNVVNEVLQGYNGLGQLTTEYQSHAGQAGSLTPKVHYGYTEMSGNQNNSRLTSMTYPNLRVLNYVYSGLDSNISRLSSISDNSGILESYKYLGLDTVVERDHPQANSNLTYISQNGSTLDAGDQYTGLDRFGRVVDQNWVNSSGTSTDRFKYGYDRDGNRLYRTNELYHLNDELYRYDQLNQLTYFARGALSASTQGGPLDTVTNPSTTESWNLDALGNWTSVTTNGVAQNRAANQQNQVTSVGAQTLSFDLNGNTLVDERGQQYTYDAWNRLVKVSSSGGTTLATYAYDGLGRRIVENEGGVARDLYYSAAWQVLEERVSGVTKAQYVWSPVYVDALVERDRDPTNSGTLSERLFVQQDANWNVTALVDTAVNVKERYTYDPYGQVTVFSSTWNSQPGGSAYAWNYLHQSGRLDLLTGLYNFRNRDYSTTLGRWMQVDPLGFAAGDSNLYRTESDGPTAATDPTGLTGYADDFKDLVPELNEGYAKDWRIHHTKEQWLREKWKAVGIDVDAVENLRGIPEHVHEEINGAQSKFWADQMKQRGFNPNSAADRKKFLKLVDLKDPTWRKTVEDFEKEIEKTYGKYWITHDKKGAFGRRANYGKCIKEINKETGTKKFFAGKASRRAAVLPGLAKALAILAVFGASEKILSGLAFADGIANPSPEAIEGLYRGALKEAEGTGRIRHNTAILLRDAFVNFLRESKADEELLGKISGAIGLAIDVHIPANDD